MKICLIIWFTAICFLPCFGQKKAKDFKVTTTDLKTIELYKDYLNKGKVVMVQIFFVDCPPCNEIAPNISALYKKYGSGSKRVEFIELSNKSWDNNAAVQGYKTRYNLNFPSVSSEGGSVQAAALYSDNSYGSFLGTPTFIIIDPTGGVTFDPRGQHADATTVRLDTALARALRVPTVPGSGSGGEGNNPSTGIKRDTLNLHGKLSLGSSTLGLVTLKLSWNKKSYTFRTDIQGSFKFQAIDTARTTNDIRMEVEYPLDYITSVSTIDLILIQKHILGVKPFGDYKQVIAADADLNGEINVVDLVELRKLILGLQDKLTAPSSQVTWINHRNLIRNLSQAIPLEDIKSLGSNGIQLEIVKTGDVSLYNQ
ncbi:MAG TPA: redoxin domain-containing protein [Saprospiraceae bacterium]|nr:redoxin domain-containing protein [Saprospiraceae bacterium]HNT20691.1 redoxin domain-containing protein [Saprospiraceae bacterium]